MGVEDELRHHQGLGHSHEVLVLSRVIRELAVTGVGHERVGVGAQGGNMGASVGRWYGFSWRRGWGFYPVGLEVAVAMAPSATPGLAAVGIATRCGGRLTYLTAPLLPRLTTVGH